MKPSIGTFLLVFREKRLRNRENALWSPINMRASSRSPPRVHLPVYSGANSGTFEMRHLTVRHNHADCWIACDTRQGYCNFCGTGACCKQEFASSPQECGFGALGCIDNHCCVAPATPKDAPAPPSSLLSLSRLSVLPTEPMTFTLQPGVVAGILAGAIGGCLLLAALCAVMYCCCCSHRYSRYDGILDNITHDIGRLKSVASSMDAPRGVGLGGRGGGACIAALENQVQQQQRRGLLMPSPPGTPHTPVSMALATNTEAAVLAREVAAMQKEEAALIAAEEAEIAAEEAALEAQLAAEARVAAGLGAAPASTYKALYGLDVRRPPPGAASSGFARSKRTWKPSSALAAVHTALQASKLPPPSDPFNAMSE